MKYYVSVVQNPGEVDEAKYISDYTTVEDAYAIFHQELAVRDSSRKGTICKIFAEDGAQVDEETYTLFDNIPTEIFYILIIQNQGEAGESDAVYRRDSYDSALAMYHQELGYRHETRNSTIVSILSRSGNSVKDGSYFKPVEE